MKMSKHNKIVVVGGCAGGASTAARIRRLDEFAEITIFEKGPYVSYSNCGIPFYLSGQVASSENLLLMTPENFDQQYNIQAKVNHEVVEIDRKNKTVKVLNHETGESFQESYDYLILAPGARALKPQSIQGVDSDHVFTIKTVPDVRKLADYLSDHDVKDVAVVGAGFIGLEVLDNLHQLGLNLSLIEAADQVLTPIDEDLAQILHRSLYDHGIKLYLGHNVQKIESDAVVLESGASIPAQAVVLALGVAPNSDLASQAGLAISETGHIVTNHHYQTTDPYIYAVGDAIEINDYLTGKPRTLALAGPAQWQARAAADHIYGRTVQNKGVQGSLSIKLLNYNVASTGYNEKFLQAEGIPYDFAYIIPKDRVGLMPGSKNLFFKLLFAKPSGKILGAQAISEGDAVKRVDVVATAIRAGFDLEDLKNLELTYSPHFCTAKDPVNHAALVGLNILNGEFKKVPVTAVRKLVEEGAFIIDAREEDEYELSHLKGAKNIPLSQFRQRLDEIPHDQPVYIHCRSSQRSYNMVRALEQRGYSNVYNIDGSYLGLSEYEYYRDQVTGRKSILTAYNFD